ncbi:hypothetical protein [Bradyrhizobium lablabi]|uniref:hypothetical protein n=1 Tax=Bradyrhizobium lablabi TaxID=722472 RepID=UPI00090997CF|nr:hypothetical protein [Bradyrhizobium lablabi]SHM33150.1 hypothetical protein SAMN05444321_5993 [Bradyrhizobium lablabi]
MSSTGESGGSADPRTTDFQRRSRAVTAAGAALILSALIAGQSILTIFRIPFSLVAFQGISLVSTMIFAFAAAAIILRLRGWRIWAGTAAWLAMNSAVSKLQLILTSRLVPNLEGLLNSLQVVTALAMLAISIFVLWASRQKEGAATDVRSDDVTVSGTGLLVLGITTLVNMVAVYTVTAGQASTGVVVLALIFTVIAFAGLATILRLKGWRIWAGTVSWLLIAATAEEFVRLIYRLAVHGFMLADLRPWPLFAFVNLVCVLVLWAKRQEKVPALNR